MAIVFMTLSGVAHASNVHAEMPYEDLLDAPTTSGISDVSVLEDASNTVINLFGAFEDAEDADEDLIYTVTENTNPSLFTATIIDPINGFLTLDYAPNQNGPAYYEEDFQRQPPTALLHCQSRQKQ